MLMLKKYWKILTPHGTNTGNDNWQKVLYSLHFAFIYLRITNLNPAAVLKF